MLRNLYFHFDLHLAVFLCLWASGMSLVMERSGREFRSLWKTSAACYWLDSVWAKSMADLQLQIERTEKQWASAPLSLKRREAQRCIQNWKQAGKTIRIQMLWDTCLPQVYQCFVFSLFFYFHCSDIKLSILWGSWPHVVKVSCQTRQIIFLTRHGLFNSDSCLKYDRTTTTVTCTQLHEHLKWIVPTAFIYVMDAFNKWGKHSIFILAGNILLCFTHLLCQQKRVFNLK